MQQTEKTQVISTKQSYACQSLRGHTWEKQKLGRTEPFHCVPCWGSSSIYNSQNPNAGSGKGSLRPTTSKCSAFAPGKPEDIMPEVGITCGCTCKMLIFHLSTQLVPLFPLHFWWRGVPSQLHGSLPRESLPQGGCWEGAEGAWAPSVQFIPLSVMAAQTNTTPLHSTAGDLSAPPARHSSSSDPAPQPLAIAPKPKHLQAFLFRLWAVAR